ncbi:protein translocase subunit SecD [Thermithiobacillus tepidarius DSM 3134]|uniref:protein translocase subunit SecD n=1 Tax=Thermithiobacillus tepidarius TaxID=929 RepID=UPI00041421A5|nr:protein translocase subunit SecD [Thermithiobacillus tepidarius]
MNRYPLWKYLLILAVLIPSFLYALPNVYGTDPALEIKAPQGTAAPSPAQVESLLQQARIPYLQVRQGGGEIRARFPDAESQASAQVLLRQRLPAQTEVALASLSAAPGWLQALGAKPVNLGLDLRGGVYLLLQVQTEVAINRAVDRYVDELRVFMREKGIQYLRVEREGAQALRIKLNDQAALDAAGREFGERYPELALLPERTPDGLFLRVTLTDAEKERLRKFAVEQGIITIRNRIDQLGVSEPVIQRQGIDRIAVQLPGVQDTARAKQIIGSTAQLEFKMVDEEHDVAAAVGGSVPAGDALYYGRDGQPYLLKTHTVLTGEFISDAGSGIDQQTGQAIVNVSFDGRGTRIFSRLTTENVGKRMAILLDDKVITAPVINEPITGGRAQINGFADTQEAHSVAIMLRAGALPAPVAVVEERSVGPSLGQDSIEQGINSIIIGMLVVLAFMTFYYRLFGLVANLALALNVVLIIAALSLLGATLTLPGMAGIVLTVGMAVDANVLIYERIREELRNGMSPRAAVDAGFERAMTTIIDSNITTLIAGLVLFQFGTGPVRGFAVVLSIGILTSMFTAVMVSRAVIQFVMGRRRLQKLYI